MGHLLQRRHLLSFAPVEQDLSCTRGQEEKAEVYSQGDQREDREGLQQGAPGVERTLEDLQAGEQETEEMKTK